MSRILILTTDLAWGGAERVVLEEALAFRAGGDAVQIAGLRHAGGELDRRASAAGFSVACLPRAGRARSFRALLARERIEIVHAHLFHAAELVRRTRAAVPWLLHVHNVETRPLPWRRVLERRQALAAHAVIAVSFSCARDWSRRTSMPSERIHVLPNVVAPSSRELTAPNWSGPLRLGFLARLVREKGADLWIRAFPQGLPPHTTLEIGGEGRTELALARWAARTGARVTRHGMVRDLDLWFESVDALVVPPRREGFGLAAAEALVRGRAVAFADLPALRELAGPDAPEGIFFAPRARALAAAVEALRGDRERRSSWARTRGAELLRRATPETHLAALHALHRAALGR